MGAQMSEGAAQRAISCPPSNIAARAELVTQMDGSGHHPEIQKVQQKALAASLVTQVNPDGDSPDIVATRRPTKPLPSSPAPSRPQESGTPGFFEAFFGCCTNPQSDRLDMDPMAAAIPSQSACCLLPPQVGANRGRKCL